jgi:hypothetical protein
MARFRAVTKSGAVNMRQILIASYIGELPVLSAMPQTNRPLAECRKLHSTAEKAHV